MPTLLTRGNVVKNNWNAKHTLQATCLSIGKHWVYRKEHQRPFSKNCLLSGYEICLQCFSFSSMQKTANYSVKIA